MNARLARRSVTGCADGQLDAWHGTPGDDHLSERNFDRLAAHIHDCCGIKMPPSKRTMLEARLRRRMREAGVGRIDEYCDMLFAAPDMGGEAEHLINAVTTNKTDFFREAQHFTFLRDVALPEIWATGRRRLRAWSAACSTGAEPYSLAMVVDAFIRANGGTYSILATDLDTDVLKIARAGIYPSDAVKPVPAALASRYVMRCLTPRRQVARIVPTLRSRITYAALNLMAARYQVGDRMDVIFCRNVLIYFDRDTQRKVVSRLLDCLTPGGYLVLGLSESAAGAGLPLKQVSTTVYVRA